MDVFDHTADGSGGGGGQSTSNMITIKHRVQMQDVTKSS